jgi:carbon monoxide dehydrogenase subunit G
MAQETENATSEIKDKASDLKDKASSNGGGGVISSLLSKEIVIPALATAGTVAAYAIKKGMSEATDKAEDEAENVGSRAAQGAKKGLAGGLGGMASKAFGGGGGGGGGSAKKTRRLPIQRWTDVAAPIETVYERWTDFEEFPSFMHRVLNVEKEDDTIKWDEKIWFSKRHWEGEITERRKNERIAWKTTSGMAHAGVVTFHRMEKNLTRVMVDMDFVPQGMIEKMASGMRFVKRAVEADLARFKAYVELGEAKDLEYNVKPEEREGDDKNKDDDKNQSDENGNENEASDDDKEREGDRETAGARS